jgi:subfamily B ATP-binding cassette protein MsbA
LIDVFQQPDQAAQFNHINTQTLILIGIFAGQAIFTCAQTYCFTLMAEKVAYTLRLQVYQHLQALPISFYVRKRVGELGARLNTDVQQLREGIANHLAGMIRHAIMTIGTVLLMIYLNWQLTALALISVMLIVGTSLLVLKRVKVASALETAFETTKRRERIQLFALPMTNIIAFGALMIVMWYGGRQMLAGTTTAGVLIAYLAYAGMMTASLAQTSKHLGGLYKGLGAVASVYNLLDQPVPSTPLKSVTTSPTVQGRVEFVDVRFTYEGTLKPAIDDFSLSIAPGEVIAIVGPSGAGKSTLTNLLLNFYTPQRGRIYLDGYALTEIDSATLRQQIGIVLQEAHLFTGTIRENIRYGRLEATDQEVEEAARVAYAHDFIMELVDGYDTEVGQRGTALSAGQRQRITIARGILKQPQLLILDEATSALDNRNESLVQAAIVQLMAGRTTLVIAHRLTTIRHADRIVVLDQGRIAEVGTHNQLMTRHGLYHQLYQQQQTSDTKLTSSVA